MSQIFWKAVAVGHFLVPNASTSWLYFTPAETLAVNRAPIKKQRYHPVPRAPGSVLFFSQTGLWQLHACTLAEVKAVTSEGTVKSQPALDDVGVLPTITQMFPISWASPILLTHFRHRLNCWSATINHWKHFMNVNEKIGLIETRADISNDNLHVFFFLLHPTHHLNSWHISIPVERGKNVMNK